MSDTNGTGAISRADVAAKHLIGNLWYKLDAVPLIAGRLQPDVMRRTVNGPATLAYTEMCKMLRGGQALNAGQLEANLRESGFDFGWLQQAQRDITNDSLEDLYRYVGELQNAADLLDVKTQCIEALKQANEAGASADRIKAELLSAMTTTQTSEGGPVHVSEIVAEVREDFQKMRDGAEEFGASTGLKTLDKFFRLVDGEYITIGGRPSQGKTSLAMWMAYSRALELQRTGENGQVLIFSMDDTRRKLIRALACTIAQVDSNRLKRKEATAEEWERVTDITYHIEDLPIYIDGGTQLTIEDIHFRAAMQKTIKPVRLIILDYIEKVKATQFKNDELLRLKYIASGYKDIGHMLGCPHIMLSQLAKGVELRADKWPTASDLKYAGEDESDVILLVNRPEHWIAKGENIDCRPEDEKGIALINVAKMKEGGVGLVRLGYKKEFARFADLEFVREELN